MYYPLAATVDLDISFPFNSTAYPGVCKPTNEATLTLVQDFQRQLNRCAEALKLPKVGTDGSIGPLTLALLGKVVAASEPTLEEIVANTSDCIAVATDLASITEQVQHYADILGAPTSVSNPGAASGMGPGRVSIIPKGGKETPRGAAASLVDSFNNLSSVEKVAVLGTLGAVGFVAWSSMNRGKKRRGKGRS